MSSITISGLWNYEAQTVGVYLANLNCGEYTVGSGQVTVPYQSDPDQLLTADYLVTVSDAAPVGGYWPNAIALDVYPSGPGPVRVIVPCTIGKPYTAQARRMRTLAEQSGKLRQGPSLGETRRVHKAAFDVVAGTAGQVVAGTDPAFATVFPLDFTSVPDGPPSTVLDQVTTFQGVYVLALDDEHSYDGQLGWQTSAPQPLVIAAAESFLETAER